MRFSARFFALALVAAAPAAALAQSPAADTTKPQGKPGKVLISTPELLTLVKTKAAVAKIQDSMDVELAKPSNKKDEVHASLRASMVRQTAAAIQKNGLTQGSYDKMMFTVSVDSATRRVYDSVWVAVTGVPIQYLAILARQSAAGGGRGGGRGAAAPVVIPPGVGAAATHLGHVLNSYNTAPDAAGLLPTAEQEAATAAQHATLGARMPTDLDYMKTHAGHVIHALDPSQVPTLTAPGRGYGMKRAALDAGVHTDMAVKMAGVPAMIVTHGGHVQQAANAAAARADEAVAIAKQIQAATSATDAAALYTKLIAITAQIVAGVDTNGDGTIGYAAPEGGLAQARTHIDLLLREAGGDRR
jgi:hypothetical protein